MTTASPGILAILFLVSASGASAQQHPAQPAPHARQDSTHHAQAYHREVPAALAHQAHISEDSARGIAMRRVPGGVVQALELERENGHLIYSFDLKLAGHTGIEEVNVDALNGRIVEVAHEEAAAERREQQAEQRHGARAHADSAGHRPAAPPHAAPAPRRP